MLPQARKFWLKLITFKLAAFEGELVKLKGSCLVNVQYENIYHTLTLIVTKGHCPNLLELNCLSIGSSSPAVLCHKSPSTQEIPVAFYSETLSTTEGTYAQIDKEALTITASIKKLHDYLYNRQFTIITDN
ncbi:hypothetical protein T4D_11633 [Trichinella pseudospiralis]|uniref:Reverse transcriptase RNase H-like domain-containing protein n=1 Tax=Trichinella pseudospiralis TaxID=6337 RepID=A0A0V1FD24_TRIPS|nr:hypothetical protein T4D_11633 [Trichinella pseudospiralis]